MQEHLGSRQSSKHTPNTSSFQLLINSNASSLPRAAGEQLWKQLPDHMRKLRVRPKPELAKLFEVSPSESPYLVSRLRIAHIGTKHTVLQGHAGSIIPTNRFIVPVCASLCQCINGGQLGREPSASAYFGMIRRNLVASMTGMHVISHQVFPLKSENPRGSCRHD